METQGERLLRLRKAKKLTQKALADAAGVSQGTIGNIESGIRGYGDSVVDIARVLGAEPDYLRMRDQTDGTFMVPVPAGAPSVEEVAAQYGGEHVLALRDDDALPEGTVLIPEYQIRFSAGPGSQPVFEEIVKSTPATYQYTWIRQEGLSAPKLRRFKVHGDSMEDILFDGDTMLVNLAETAVRDGWIYAFLFDGELRVKRLYRTKEGGLVMISQNPNHRPREETASPEEVAQSIRIIGRVRDSSGPGRYKRSS